MPPKRWQKPPTAPPNPVEALLEYVCSEINSNNCLGLAEDEVNGMARELASSGTRKEVFDWANTLMMGEAFAAEIIKRREDFGPPFDGEATLSMKAPAQPTVTEFAASAAPAKAPAGKKAAANTNTGKKNKRNVVDLAQMQGKKKTTDAAAVKPGRFECGCFATMHNLRGNCANCGRIICEQESEEVCYFCGMDPSRCINYEIAVQDGKVSEAAVEQNKEIYEQAIERRNKLLEYAQNRAKRTTVIDDQSASLFSPQSVWSSPAERKKQEKSLAEEQRRKNIEKLHRHTGAYQVHVDFVNQNVTLGARESNAGEQEKGNDKDAENSEENSSDGVCDPIDAGLNDEKETESGVDLRAEPLPSLLQRIWYSPDGSHVEEAMPTGEHGSRALDTEANRPLNQKPVKRFEEISRRVQQNYFEDDNEVFAEETRESQQTELVFSPDSLLLGSVGSEREKDGEFGGVEALDNTTLPVVKDANDAFEIRFAPTPQMKSRDDGVCLSMHQPWASLLVAGIKRHEGRVWSTNYRGRLWIHAASKEPHDLEETEEHYKQFIPPGSSFPKDYPTRVLLGYVYVTACYDRDEYEEAFPPDERQESSPYSFICTEAKVLPFPLPMEGNHKLFTLEHKVLVAAKKQLREIT